MVRLIETKNICATVLLIEQYIRLIESTEYLPPSNFKYLKKTGYLNWDQNVFARFFFLSNDVYIFMTTTK